jgi:DNA uptake protein ComE-like DNA-binding protein
VFNDGGLVDINAVPEHTLAALPGVTVPQAQQIVARRRAAGNFGSVEDLVTAGLLPLPTVRALSDVLIVIDGVTPPLRPTPERLGELRS